MPATARHTLVCSVLFLDIEGYSKRTVAEQLALKERFNGLLLGALEHVAPDSRVLLDTGDGAAVGFLGAPEDALFAAITVREGCGPGPTGDELPLRIRMGINLGPVRLLKDINGRTNIIGDGINDAQRVMSFAEPGGILASRAYYEVVSRVSSDFARLFVFQGVRTDKHVREHSVYAVGTPDAVSDVREETLPAPVVAPAFRTAPAPRPKSSGRIMLLAGLLVVAVGAALFVTGQNDGPPPIEEPPTDVHPSVGQTAPAPPPPAQASVDKPHDGARDKDKNFDADVFRPAHKTPHGAPANAEWLAEMRSELAACNAKGFLQSGVCSERVRWKFCAPDHWNTVDECTVEQGSKSTSQP